MRYETMPKERERERGTEKEKMKRKRKRKEKKNLDTRRLETKRRCEDDTRRDVRRC
jgi:hypothetical protein